MSPKKAEDKKTPVVSVRARGRVNATLNELGRLYKERNIDRDCRWVYAPTHKPDLSNVFGRKAQGYVEVTIGELPEAEALMPGLSSDDVVRVGDVILMSIEAEVREQFKKDLHNAAEEQSKQVGRKFYESLMSGGEISSSGSAHKATGKGSVTIEEKSFEYEVEQRTSGEKE